MPVDSLLVMAQRACCRLAPRITDVGDIPYELIRSVLMRIENAENLHQIELNSPQIVGQDGEIWLALIKRDVPDWEKRQYEPDDPKNWYRLYKTLKRQAEEDMARGEGALKAALDSIQQDRNLALAPAVVAHELLPPVIEVIKFQNKMVVKRGPKRKIKPKPSHLQTTLHNMKAPVVFGARTAIPYHELKKQASKIAKAPDAFVDEIRRSGLQKLPDTASSTPVLGPPIRVPRQSLAAPTPQTSSSTPIGESLVEREARLLAVKEGRPLPLQRRDSMPAGQRRDASPTQPNSRSPQIELSYTSQQSPSTDRSWKKNAQKSLDSPVTGQSVFSPIRKSSISPFPVSPFARPPASPPARQAPEQRTTKPIIRRSISPVRKSTISPSPVSPFKRPSVSPPTLAVLKVTALKPVDIAPSLSPATGSSIVSPIPLDGAEPLQHPTAINNSPDQSTLQQSPARTPSPFKLAGTPQVAVRKRKAAPEPFMQRPKRTALS